MLARKAKTVSKQFLITVHAKEGLILEGRGGDNLGVIVVRVCEPVFQNLPHSYTWPLKIRTHSYT